jgi:acetolactate synthase-1/2/3 large subunit
MPEMTGARFLAESLEAYGVTHVFFVPAILSYTLAELERRTGIRRILTHGEKAAVYMADGYARATGRPGVCFAQCVGAANLAAGLRDPYLACTPMVMLTGGPYTFSRHRHQYQEISDLPLFEPVTKYNAHVDDVKRLPDVLRQAFRAATTGTPGPTHIQVEGHLGELERQKADLEILAEERFRQVPPFRPVAEAGAIAEAARLLARAERPVIVVGGGSRASGAGPELRALAEKLSIPVSTSLNAKDLLPGDHPLNLGVPGTYARASANRALRQADLVFFVGSHTGSQVTLNWQVPAIGTPVIQLDIEPQELGRHYPNQVSLLGDAKATLAELAREVDGSTASRRAAWAERVRSLGDAWRAEWTPLLTSDVVPMRPERLCKELTDHMPSDTLMVVETGHSGMWTGGMVDLNRPGQGFIRAAGSLGWGLPAALGAKLAQPERPVLLFSGDGGFWYHLAELETAVRCGINAVLLINNNLSLNQEIAIYADAYGGQLEGRHGELWKFTDASFAAIAETMGARGIRVEKPGEIAGALDQAFSANRPCVVEVMTEMTAVAPIATVD